MKSTPPIAEAAEFRELFSVDADAHLEKLSAHILPSPALLPVELVRSALKRKATRVDIHIRNERIVIHDNGTPIGMAEWQALACLADSRSDPTNRENAMASILDLAHPGIGLLAVFLPATRRIQIENGKTSMRIENGRCDPLPAGAGAHGVLVTIMRRRGPLVQERALLGKLCSDVQAEITINGRPLNKKPLLADHLVSIKIGANDRSGPSRLSIPVLGDVCRIWLLDQGIPWQVTAMAAVQGSIFAAAIETSRQLTAPVLETLSAEAKRLYRWLAENYARFPEPFQRRIEDLFFRQARAEGDLGLLSLCAPFRVWGSTRRLTLNDIRRQSEHNELVACDHGGLTAFSASPEADALRLTPQQKDFLINQLHLPIRFLNVQQLPNVRPQRFLKGFRFLWHGLQKHVRPTRFRIKESDNLSREEIRFCRELEMEWRRQSPQAGPEKHLSVAMIEGRGLAPARWLKKAENDTLWVRRRHPVTLRAIQHIGQYPCNGELAFAALKPGRFLTEDGQWLRMDDMDIMER